MAASAGGLNALTLVLGALSKDFPVGIQRREGVILMMDELA